MDDQTYRLPYSLRLQREGADDLELLSAHIPLTEIDGAGTVGVRSEWVGLAADFQVNRVVRANQSELFGVLQYPRLAGREGIAPSGVLARSADELNPGTLRAQLEVTQELAPFAHLCQGTPHHYMPVRPTLDLGGYLGAHYWLESAHRLAEVPAAIRVRGYVDKEHPDGVEEELFPPWLPGSDEDISTFFPRLFRGGNDRYQEFRPGQISAPLPRPKENGEYRFFLRWPGRREDDEVGRVRLPGWERRPRAGRWERTFRYVATLDTRGWLTIHRGNPPYWNVGSLKAVEQHAGAVLRVPMDRGYSWAPANGAADAIR